MATINDLLNDVKRFLKVDVDNTNYDGVIQGSIDMATKFVENECGVKLSQATYTETFRGRDVVYNRTGEGDFILLVYVKNRPLVSVTSVKVDGNLVSSDDYYINGDGIYINEYGSEVEVTYVAGYEQIPGDLYGAIIRIASVFFFDRDGRLNVQSIRAEGEEITGWYSYFDDRIKRILDQYKYKGIF